MRALRTHLAFTRLEAANALLLVTGPGPGVGKTTLAFHLARITAAAGLRVLLIDADLRRGRLHRLAGPPRQPGLAEVLGGLATPMAAIAPTRIEGVDCLPAGRRPPNPAELLLGERCSALLHEVQRDYDLVILDIPPLLAVTDAALLAYRAATTLLVVRHGHSRLKELEAAHRQLVHGGGRVQGVVINGV